MSPRLFLLFFILIFSCKSPELNFTATEKFYAPGSAEASVSDSSTDAFINPYRKELESEMNVVLARSLYPLEKGQPESLLGNFVADLCMETAIELYKEDPPIDFCVLNNGGLRNSLPKGNITRGKVFELMPFENELVVLTLSSETTMQLLEYIAAHNGVPVSGLRMSIKEGIPSDILIGGSKFDTSRSYKVVTSDYLATGGDSMTMFADALKTEQVGIMIRDAIIQYLISSNSKQPFISAQTDGRISK